MTVFTFYLSFTLAWVLACVIRAHLKGECGDALVWVPECIPCKARRTRRGVTLGRKRRNNDPSSLVSLPCIPFPLKSLAYKQEHIHNGIWTMLAVRWSHALLALPFIAFFLFLGSYKQYKITLISFGPTLWPYSNHIVTCASSITFLLTINHLMLHLQQPLLVLHFY